MQKDRSYLLYYLLVYHFNVAAGMSLIALHTTGQIHCRALDNGRLPF